MIEVRLLSITSPNLTLGAGSFPDQETAVSSARNWCRAQFHPCQVEVNGVIVARLDSYGDDLP